jgi:hypothetical protein
MSNIASQNRARSADIIIVGAGPAGLAASAACRDAGVQAMLLERGNPAQHRDRYLPEDIGEGVGGAGLFSDGKFSFYPSATHLWELQPVSSLIAAYGWSSGVLRPFGIEVPPFPETQANSSSEQKPDSFRIKEYPSFRIPLSERLELVRSLTPSDGSIRTLAEVISMRIEDERVVVNIRYGKEQVEEEFIAKAAIIAIGRLGAMRVLPWLNVDSVFRRLEVGVRIEQAEDSFFLRDARGLDPKLIAQDRSGIEWRTFCCCRGGEVVNVVSNGVLATAGRSDVDRTKMSNVAFHVRITDQEFGGMVTSNVLSRLDQPPRSFSIRVDQLGDDSKLNGILCEKFGPKVAGVLMLGLQKLQHEYDIRGPVTVHGPAVEGVGYYPRLGPNLRLDRLPVWLPGDVGGLFRGLTAALVSGYFAGGECAAYVCA